VLPVVKRSWPSSVMALDQWNCIPQTCVCVQCKRSQVVIHDCRDFVACDFVAQGLIWLEAVVDWGAGTRRSTIQAWQGTGDRNLVTTLSGHDRGFHALISQWRHGAGRRQIRGESGLDIRVLAHSLPISLPWLGPRRTECIVNVLAPETTLSAYFLSLPLGCARRPSAETSIASQ
jgi:hypothetical protein